MKTGTRGGQPHYGVNCLTGGCAGYSGGSVIAIGHLSKEGAESRIQEHLESRHGAKTPPGAPALG